MNTPFHISLPCNNVATTKSFYEDIVGASLGRFTDNWVDVNLYGHQLTFTNAGKFDFNNPNYVFQGKILPSFHFGVILDNATWKKVYARLNEQNLPVVTETTFLKDTKGEHTSFFIKDPNDYMLEFKSFKNIDDIFLN